MPKQGKNTVDVSGVPPFFGAWEFGLERTAHREKTR